VGTPGTGPPETIIERAGGDAGDKR